MQQRQPGRRAQIKREGRERARGSARQSLPTPDLRAAAAARTRRTTPCPRIRAAVCSARYQWHRACAGAARRRGPGPDPAPACRAGWPRKIGCIRDRKSWRGIIRIRFPAATNRISAVFPYAHFLQARGVAATFDEHGDALVATTPALPQLLDRDVISVLPYWSTLQVAGPDAAKFLQGQLTCDVAQATTTQAVPGAHCTPKGRIRSSFLIGRRDEQTHWLRVRSDLLTTASAALGKYIVFSKAAIAAQEQLAVLGLYGPNAAAAIASFAGAAPQGLNGV
ncbi:conserved hypothetical protein, partial [Ricinus communis]